MKESIYVSGLGDIEFEVLKDVAKENGYFELIRIYSGHLDVKVKDLKNFLPEDKNIEKVRVILFENMDNKRVIQFINIFKNLKLPSAIFALVTEHNREWTFRKLVFHLLKEHTEMQNRAKQNNDLKTK